MPERIQLSRARGWRMPANTVKVDRTTRWGNPFKLTRGATTTDVVNGETITRPLRVEDLVLSFRRLLERTPSLRAKARQDLRGKNLACWCRPGDPCHADVLLEIANEEEPAHG